MQKVIKGFLPYIIMGEYVQTDTAPVLVVAYSDYAEWPAGRIVCVTRTRILSPN